MLVLVLVLICGDVRESTAFVAAVPFVAFEMFVPHVCLYTYPFQPGILLVVACFDDFHAGVIADYTEASRVEELDRYRDLLNGLVAESVGKTDGQVRRCQCWG